MCFNAAGTELVCLSADSKLHWVKFTASPKTYTKVREASIDLEGMTPCEIKYGAITSTYSHSRWLESSRDTIVVGGYNTTHIGIFILENGSTQKLATLPSSNPNGSIPNIFFEFISKWFVTPFGCLLEGTC